MANTVLEELQAKAATRASVEKHTLLMWVLLAGGVFLVLVSNVLGRMVVQSCDMNGNCSWSPDDAREAVLNWRCLGGMAFAMGLVERLTLAIKGAGRTNGEG